MENDKVRIQDTRRRRVSEGLRREESTLFDVRLSYHNWKLAACVESLKSIPMETATEASGSSRSADGREEAEEE